MRLRSSPFTAEADEVIVLEAAAEPAQPAAEPAQPPARRAGATDQLRYLDDLAAFARSGAVSAVTP